MLEDLITPGSSSIKNAINYSFQDTIGILMYLHMDGCCDEEGGLIEDHEDISRRHHLNEGLSCKLYFRLLHLI